MAVEIAGCTLCPRRCGIIRPETLNGGKNSGFCRMPRSAVVARAGLHFWEEPIISGQRGSGAIFFSGCNLRCVFCQNHNISTCGTGRVVSIERLKDICLKLIAQGAHNINLVTPTHFTDIISKLLEEKFSVPVVWNSNAYESVEVLKSLRGKVDIFLPDLKYADKLSALKYSAAPDYFEVAVKAIDEMFEQTGPFEFDHDGMLKKGVVIRHLILPGQVENSLKIIDYIRSRFRPGEVLFSLMRQYIPCGVVSAGNFPELNRQITEQEYEAVEQALFASGIEDGFVQDAEAASAEFIPAFDGSGV